MTREINLQSPYERKSFNLIMTSATFLFVVNLLNSYRLFEQPVYSQPTAAVNCINVTSDYRVQRYSGAAWFMYDSNIAARYTEVNKNRSENAKK